MASASFTKLPSLLPSTVWQTVQDSIRTWWQVRQLSTGSLMRLVVEHHGLHAGFGSAHGTLGVVDGQQHGGVGLTTHQAGNRVHLLELGLGLFGMATGAGSGAGHDRGFNGGGFGGGFSLHFLGGKLLRALGSAAFLAST